MFFFGFASNIVTLVLLGLVSLLFFYQGASDALNNFLIKPEQAKIENYQEKLIYEIETNNYRFQHITIQQNEFLLRNYPNFVHFDYPELVEKISFFIAFPIELRGPPSV